MEGHSTDAKEFWRSADELTFNVSTLGSLYFAITMSALRLIKTVTKLTCWLFLLVSAKGTVKYATDAVPGGKRVCVAVAYSKPFSESYSTLLQT
jgi:hypothetical protein